MLRAGFSAVGRAASLPVFNQTVSGKLVLNRHFAVFRAISPRFDEPPALRRRLVQALCAAGQPTAFPTMSGQLESMQHRMLAVKDGQLAASGKNVRSVTAVFLHHRRSRRVLPEVP